MLTLIGEKNVGFLVYCGKTEKILCSNYPWTKTMQEQQNWSSPKTFLWAAVVEQFVYQMWKSVVWDIDGVFLGKIVNPQFPRMCTW